MATTNTPRENRNFIADRLSLPQTQAQTPDMILLLFIPQWRHSRMWAK